MFCRNCGNQLPDNALFCSACGSSVAPAESAPVEQAQEVVELAPAPQENTGYQTYEEAVALTPPPAQPKKLNVLGLVGFILSCCSFLFIFIDIGFISVAGLICSIIALCQQGKNPGKYKLTGFAIAGVCVGSVGALIFLIMFAVVCSTCAAVCSATSGLANAGLYM